MLWSSGKALRFVSMPLFTVFKNLAVVGTTAWEFFRFGERHSMGVVLSLGLMITGSIVAAQGDLTISEAGIFWMLVNVTITVAYVASLKEFLPKDIPASHKTLHNNMLTMVIFSTVSVVSGEIGPFLGALSEQTWVMKTALLTTGILGTAINIATFWCARVASGGTYAFVGATNKVPVAILGHLLFHSELTLTGWVGVAFGLGAGFVYAMTKERERRARLQAEMERSEDSDIETQPLTAESSCNHAQQPVPVQHVASIVGAGQRVN